MTPYVQTRMLARNEDHDGKTLYFGTYEEYQAWLRTRNA